MVPLRLILSLAIVRTLNSFGMSGRIPPAGLLVRGQAPRVCGCRSVYEPTIDGVHNEAVSKRF